MSQAERDSKHDVVVIGGGPAGSTIATLLARAGIDVLVLEAEQFPRDHIGESLLPATLTLLETMGVLEDVQAAGFTVKRGATMRWGRTQEPWSWYFAETNQRHPTSFQVWRPTFDRVLLQHSERVGATVIHGPRVQSVMFDGDRAIGARLTDGSEIGARLVVDCSGQRCLLGRQLGLQQFDDFFRNLAVYAYYVGAKPLAPPNEGNIYIESYEHGWTWNIPLVNPYEPGGPKWASVGCVVDRERCLPLLRELGPARFIETHLAQTRDTRHLLADAHQIKGPAVLQDWSYRCTQFAGDGWILAGDAACFIDPLFSTGVHLAISGGYLAAALARTALTDDSELTRASNRSYERMYVRQYEHFWRLARLFYSANRTIDSYFWEARRLMASEDFSPRESFVRAVSGQTQFGYERTVLFKGELPQTFVRAVDLVSQERRQRTEEFRAWLRSQRPIRPAPVEGLKISRDAIMLDSTYVWSDVLSTTGRDDSVPCSEFVAALVRDCDGQRDLAALATRHGGDEALVRRACEILVTDGLLTLA